MKNEHVTKRLDRRARPPTRPGLREQFEQIQGQLHQHAQKDPNFGNRRHRNWNQMARKAKTIHEQAQKARTTSLADHTVPTARLQCPRPNESTKNNRFISSPLLSAVRKRTVHSAISHALKCQREMSTWLKDWSGKSAPPPPDEECETHIWASPRLIPPLWPKDPNFGNRRHQNYNQMAKKLETILKKAQKTRMTSQKIINLEITSKQTVTKEIKLTNQNREKSVARIAKNALKK